ncbi:Stk1 family PASTA domain-containing Ser/Thr kinase [Virgisporangium ochraceum]|uniref:non-specific serine/threonine protein kinase n=1 Tax=Virgisporangium ochraceum TaxID=65505 RepID=A0A8J3ZNY7_9ACTN|nr:Stk1 family PASTA domain-containing Ser/Thr kinase [Virgisporangium ochraceum]GIJ66348.1 serine/threonine protein kinase [Virgisporangium ochraceum]
MTAQARLLGGRYQVGELLGFGGMAEVHRGRDTRLGRDVAIKTLRHDLARDATFQLRFRREAQNAASLNHPAIVAVYDTGEEHAPTGEELPYIVMEYVNGRTLKEVLAIEGRIQQRRALEIVADICSALDFSHRHSIIHRDIKPGNVMLTQTGQVKVMDFGIARALASGASTMTQTSAVIGTAQYLSPEQARGEAVDARSDVYATGCVIFELLTGQPPFIGDNPVSVAYQHVREDPRAPSELNPDVTPDVDSVVLKALSKNPANRYQSAGEMRNDLLRAAAGRPVSAPPVMTEAERTAMMAPTQRPMTGTMTRPPARVPPPQRQKKGSTALVVLITVLGMLALGVLGLGLVLANQSSDVTVPDLAGKTVADANSLLDAEGLSGTQQSTSECQQATSLNKVIKQDPAANTKVAEGSNVTFQVCTAPDKATVPDLRGKTQAEAEKALRDNKLTAQVQPVDSTEKQGTVVGTSPGAGAAVDVNSVVVINISKDNQRKMPNLSGMNESEAKQALAKAGFDVNKVTIKERGTTDDDQVGKVISQTPNADSTQFKNISITLTIGTRQNNPNPGPSNPSASSSSGNGG